MTYQQATQYLFDQLPMYQKLGGIALKDGLDNILALDELLGHPHRSYPCIHIAGTNGKGSVANMMAAVLQAAGYKVGLYTSPHYKDFRERIRVNGELLREAFVVDFVEKTKKYYERIKPSFFEISVAMAFEYFKEEKVDIAVIETGLGGLKDSTNIIQPVLSIITNISYDHQATLGNTLVDIAGHKAGIIKNNTPVVIGQTQEEVKAVFSQKAAAESAPIYFADQFFGAEKLNFNGSFSNYQIFQNKQPYIDQLQSTLHGDYQKHNIVTVLAALKIAEKHQLFSLPVSIAHIREGLANVRSLTQMLGRWEILQHAPLIVADSAHNEGGLEAVVAQLRNISSKRLHIVLGVISNKDISLMLRLMPNTGIYYFAKPNIPRGLDAEELARKAADFGLLGNSFPSVQEALNAAKAKADPEDLIYVGGSTYVVAEVV